MSFPSSLICGEASSLPANSWNQWKKEPDGAELSRLKLFFSTACTDAAAENASCRAPRLQSRTMHDGPLPSVFCRLISAERFQRGSAFCLWLWLKYFRLILAAVDICCFQLCRLPTNKRLKDHREMTPCFAFCVRSLCWLDLACDPKTETQTFVLTRSEQKHSSTQFSTISQNSW